MRSLTAAERGAGSVLAVAAMGAMAGLMILLAPLESAMMALVGGVIGVLGGVGVAQIVTLAIGFPSTVALWSVVMGLLVATATGIFFGVYPARKAAMLDPIVALRAD